MLVNDASYMKVLPKIICSNKRIVYSEDSLDQLMVVNSNTADLVIKTCYSESNWKMQKCHSVRVTAGNVRKLLLSVFNN